VGEEDRLGLTAGSCARTQGVGVEDGLRLQALVAVDLDHRAARKPTKTLLCRKLQLVSSSVIAMRAESFDASIHHVLLGHSPSWGLWLNEFLCARFKASTVIPASTRVFQHYSRACRVYRYDNTQ
jgi:hypothetical protein